MLLVANGPESLSDSIISELLESRQRQGGASEKAESSSPSFEWQILHGRGGNPISGQTLAEAVDIFSVSDLLSVSYFLAPPTIARIFSKFHQQFNWFNLVPDQHLILTLWIFHLLGYIYLSGLVTFTDQGIYLCTFGENYYNVGCLSLDLFLQEFPYQIKDAAGGRNLIPLMVHR